MTPAKLSGAPDECNHADRGAPSDPPLPLFDRLPRPPALPRPPELVLSRVDLAVWGVLTREIQPPRHWCQLSAATLAHLAGVTKAEALAARRRLARLGLIILLSEDGAAPRVALAFWPSLSEPQPMTLQEHAARIGRGLQVALFELGMLAKLLAQSGDQAGAERVAGVISDVRVAAASVLPSAPPNENAREVDPAPAAAAEVLGEVARGQ